MSANLDLPAPKVLELPGITRDHPDATRLVREWMVARGLTPGVLVTRRSGVTSTMERAA